MPTVTNLWRNRLAPGQPRNITAIINPGGTVVASANGAFGAWIQVAAAGPNALFSIAGVRYGGVLASRRGAYQVGYGPAGGERVVFEGPIEQNTTTGFTYSYNPPIMSTPIPAGSRVAMRSWENAVQNHTFYVTAARLDLGVSADTLIAHPDSFFVPGKGSASGSFGTSGNWNTLIAAADVVYPLQIFGWACNEFASNTGEIGIGPTTAVTSVFTTFLPQEGRSLSPPLLPPVLPAGVALSGKGDGTVGASAYHFGCIRADLPIYRLANVSPSIYEY